MDVQSVSEQVFLILLALRTPLHGYGVMQRVEEWSDGRIVLGAGTLYGAFSRMERDGWIVRTPNPEQDRKKLYVITPAGLEVIDGEVGRMQGLMALAESIVKREGSEL